MAFAERPPHHEFDPALVEQFAATFIPRRDCYPWQQADGKYVTVHQPLTPDLLHRHLKGAVTLGAYALDTASMVHWICLDADKDEDWNSLLNLANDLEAQAVTIYREMSRRGGHLWLFTSPLPGVFARRFAKQLLSERNLSHVEVYPKQDELTSGVGSFVRLPLGRHRKTNQVYPFINQTGLPLGVSPTSDPRRLLIEQAAILSMPKRVPLQFIMRILSRIPPNPLPRPEPTPHFQRGQQSDGLPLSERLKRQISVLEFVRRYVQLDERNLGFCPFHDDQIKSFGIHPDQNYWHCFAGCGGGSIIDFWMKWRERQGQDSSFKATVTELRQMLLG